MQLLPDLLQSPIPLIAGQVHLWLLDIQQFSNHAMKQALEMMSGDEHERAQKFLRGKNEYIASRWLLRKVLGLYLQESPETVVFKRSEKGKPYVPGSSLQFNLSHSGHWAVLAVARNMQIGIDVEQGKHSRDLAGIAANYYHPDEFTQLQQRQGEEQTRFFYQLWTLKEALLKAMGVGISAGLENLNFHLRDSITVDISPTLGATSITDKWQFHQWQLPDTSYCALAAACEHSPQSCWFNPLIALA
jgi:4'-phosphopantetheinyl transferase